MVIPPPFVSCVTKSVSVRRGLNQLQTSCCSLFIRSNFDNISMWEYGNSSFICKQCKLMYISGLCNIIKIKYRVPELILEVLHIFLCADWWDYNIRTVSCYVNNPQTNSVHSFGSRNIAAYIGLHITKYRDLLYRKLLINPRIFLTWFRCFQLMY